MAHDPSWETFSPQLASVTKSLMNEMLNTAVSRVGGRTKDKENPETPSIHNITIILLISMI